VRFVWAVTAFVLAALMIGAGIAQRTVLQGPRTESETIAVTGSAPYILIDGDVLNSHPGAQTLRVQEPGTIFASYGRTSDVEAWLTPSAYTHVSMNGDATQTTSVAATTALPAGSASISPVGSDLWLDEFQQDGVLVTPLQLPADMSLLIATDGTAPAPSSVTLTWPSGATTPWAGPLIVMGSILLLIGLVLYVLGVRHARRSRGPRRKGLPMPVTEPIGVAVDDAEKGVISATPTRRRLTRGTRPLIAIPAVGLAALLFTGCTADAWPQFAGTPTPTTSESVVVPADQGRPAVTQAQAERILTRVSEDVAAADAAKDPAAAALRLTGSALAARETDYRLRDVANHTALGPIPDKPVKIILPEAYDGWPRTFFAVIETGDVILTVTQEDPWSPYKVSNQAELVSQASLNLAPAYVGAIAIDPDSPFLALPPNEVAAAYADILTNGDDSTFASSFDSTNDPFRKLVSDNRASRLQTFNQTGAETGTLTYAATAGPQEPIALATLDSGALVAVTVHESDTVKPTNTDAVIKLDNNAIVQTLTGVNQSATGFTTTFVDQLFFFVPAQSSNKRIQLLGYSTSILDAKVAP